MNETLTVGRLQAYGIAEMLLQSHDGGLDLLPALPKAWGTGSVRGLKARGGFEVDMNWSGGELTAASVHSSAGGGCVVRYRGRSKGLDTKKGKTYDVRFPQE